MGPMGQKPTVEPREVHARPRIPEPGVPCYYGCSLCLRPGQQLTREPDVADWGYVLHTIGELCLSPVGLSTVTKLAPQRLVGSMMGVLFLASSLGNFIRR